MGGVAGALSFRHVGFSSTIPLAFGLVVMSSAPMFKPQS
jgi:hypothetical protein